MVKWEKKTVKDENGTYTHWVGTPDMHLAFMRAEKKVKPDTIAEGHPLALDFKPLTTAVEVTLEAKEDMASAEVQMIHVRGLNKNKTQKQCIAGNFTYDIDQGKTTYLNQDIANDYEISVPLWASVDGGNPAPISLKANDKVTFTVFLLPAEHSTADGSGVSRDLTNLQLEVIGFDGNSQIKTYEEVMIPQGTKSQVVLPKYEPKAGSLNNWMSRIPDNVYISQLTIPGASDAYSGEMGGSTSSYVNDNAESDYTQTLSVKELFNKGVRAFEIGTSGNLNNIAAGDATLSKTFAQAMDDLKTCVAGSDEFVIVTVYFLKDGTNNWQGWVDKMADFLQKNADGYNIKPFNNETTVGEVRGNVLLIIRTNGDENVANLSNYPIIKGWNTQKDKWDRRGYDITNHDYFGEKEWYGVDLTGQWLGDKDPRAVKMALTEEEQKEKWAYDGGGSLENIKTYVNEWKRVCRTDDGQDSKEFAHRYITGLTSSKTRWYESMESEKKPLIINFFKWTKAALKDAPGTTSLYINSLNGYYIVDNRDGYSGAPNYNVLTEYGKRGNVALYSNDINTYVYTHMLSVPYEERGPVGIVFGSFMGDETFGTLAMHGDYLLKTLIGNNFTFPLKGK